MFINTFLEYGSIVLYNKCVTDPTTNCNVCDQKIIFRMAGFNGCIGSTYATHFGMLSCTTQTSINHKGIKLSIPSRDYNIKIDISRWIIGSTSGYIGTWNDKILISFDLLISNVHTGLA